MYRGMRHALGQMVNGASAGQVKGDGGRHVSLGERGWEEDYEDVLSEGPDGTIAMPWMRKVYGQEV